MNRQLARFFILKINVNYCNMQKKNLKFKYDLFGLLILSSSFNQNMKKKVENYR